MNKRIGIILLVVFLAAMGVMSLYDILFTDDKGPVIEFSDAELVYSEGQDEKILLADVKAIDDKDGDVSNTLMIAKKVVLTGGNIMKVQYAAKDRENNITIEERIVPYKLSDNVGNNNENKNQQPEESSDNSEAGSTGNNTDNNENNSESTPQQESTSNQAQPEDPTGEIDKEAANATGKPVIKLKATEATITEGQPFDAISFVKETYDNSGDVSRRIRTIGEEDIKGPGDYELYYSVSDKEGNVSDPVKFILHVKPAQQAANNQNSGNQNANNQQEGNQNPNNRQGH